MQKLHVSSLRLVQTALGYVLQPVLWVICLKSIQENLDGDTPEGLEGVGGQEQRRAKTYVIDRCGNP